MPPLTLTVISPSEPWWQVIAFVAVAVASSTSGCVISTLEVMVAETPSVTVTV